MRAHSSEALEEALREALASLDAIPAVLADAARTTTQASQQRLELAHLRRSVDGSLKQQDLVREMQSARNAMRREASSAGRGLKRHILWMQWRLFWRAARVFVFGFVLLCLLIAGIVWAVKNSEWLMEQARDLVAPAPSLSPVGPAVIQPDTAAPPVTQPGVPPLPAAQPKAQGAAPATGQPGAGIMPAPQVPATSPSPTPLQTPPPSAVQK
jgi:hypothetical protein